MRAFRFSAGLLLVAVSCTERPAALAPMDAVDALSRARATLQAHAAHADADPRGLLPASSALLHDEPGVQFERIGAGLRPHLPTAPVAAHTWRSLSRTAEVTHPAQAAGRLVVRDPESGLAVGVRLVGAAPVEGSAVSGVVVYPHAFDGGDWLQQPAADGVEDLVAVSRPHAPQLRYEVALDEAVQGLRLVANTLELLDRTGTPRLRLTAPAVYAADGAAHPIALDVEDCAVDRSAAPSWRRAPVAPGRTRCTLALRWDAALAPPFVVDPHWSTTGSMVAAHVEHRQVRLPDGRLLILDPNGPRATYPVHFDVVAPAELFDPATDTWSTTSPTPAGFVPFTLDVVAGHVIATGYVREASGTFSGTAYEWSPATGAWTRRGNMAHARDAHLSAQLADGTLLVSGGSDPTTGNMFYDTEVYDPASGTFSAVAATLPAPAVNAVTRTLGDGRVVAYRSYSGMIYDPAAHSWTALPLSAFGHQLRIVLLPGDRVLTVGGDWDNWKSGHSSAEALDPVSLTWTRLGDLNAWRQWNALTLLADGKVLAAGGYDGTSTPNPCLSSSEIYDPATDTWSVGPSMGACRDWGAATLLADGRVVYSGGESPYRSGTNTAVVLEPDHVCGNGVREAAEECDGQDLGGATCQSRMGGKGALGCTAGCTFDLSACAPATCGNGALDPGEACDGASLGGQTCASRGRGPGTLLCGPTCAFDLSGCAAPVCGDGVRNGGEECDGTDFGGEDCYSSLHRAGHFTCRPDCTIDPTTCVASSCGDGLVTGEEACDGANLNGATCADVTGGGGTLGCDATCHFDVAQCERCGDGVKNRAEACDGTDLGGATCESLTGKPGSLGCDAGCHYDVRACAVCGNGVRNDGEQCDGQDLGGKRCTDLTGMAGTLFCKDDCTLDAAACTDACDDSDAPFPQWWTVPRPEFELKAGTKPIDVAARVKLKADQSYKQAVCTSGEKISGALDLCVIEEEGALTNELCAGGELSLGVECKGTPECLRAPIAHCDFEKTCCGDSISLARSVAGSKKLSKNLLPEAWKNVLSFAPAAQLQLKGAQSGSFSTSEGPGCTKCGGAPEYAVDSSMALTSELTLKLEAKLFGKAGGEIGTKVASCVAAGVKATFCELAPPKSVEGHAGLRATWTPLSGKLKWLFIGAGADRAIRPVVLGDDKGC